MMTNDDIDTLLYNILKSSGISSKISGGIYKQDDRPDNSQLEDIVVNTITSTQDYLPQSATSNVNVFVSDKNVRVNGIEQKKTDRSRLNNLTKEVLNVLNSSKLIGATLITESATPIPEPSIEQHYVNIRIAWNIQTIQTNIKTI